MRFLSVVATITSLALAGCGDGPSAVPRGAITELVTVDQRIGDGETAARGMVAVVHYTGWLYDPETRDGRGERFDSSRDRGEPFEFPIGAQRVIRGWDEGIAGMRVGGVRTLYLPPEYAYGASGVGTIPPESTLVFEVELLDLRGGADA